VAQVHKLDEQLKGFRFEAFKSDLALFAFLEAIGAAKISSVLGKKGLGERPSFFRWVRSNERDLQSWAAEATRRSESPSTLGQCDQIEVTYSCSISPFSFSGDMESSEKAVATIEQW
jgi:hypothetical protein